MKLIFNDIGNGLCPYAPQKKPFLDSFIGGIASLLGGAVSSSMQQQNTIRNMRLQARLNQHQMAYSNGLQRSQQEWLMNRQYGATVEGMKNAGLNPAMANGTQASVPSASSPAAGPSGPSAGMPNIDLARSMAEIGLLKSQKQNIDADTNKKEKEASNIESSTQWIDFTNTPEYHSLILQGMTVDQLNKLAQAANFDSMTDYTNQQKAFVLKQMDVLDAKLTQMGFENDLIQSQTAKYLTGVLNDLKDLDVKDSVIALNYATENLKRAETKTEGTKQKLNEALTKTEGTKQKLNEANTKESKARTAGIKIENRVREFQQQVVEASGSVAEQGAVMGAKRVISLFTDPLESLIGLYSGGRKHHRERQYFSGGYFEVSD